MVGIRYTFFFFFFWLFATVLFGSRKGLVLLFWSAGFGVFSFLIHSFVLAFVPSLLSLL